MLDFDIDDFFEFEDSKPYITRPTPKMSFSIKCTVCDFEETEDYQRQDPDQLLSHLNCPHCQEQTLILVSAIPFTVSYQSHSMREASFFDDVSSECWECQQKKGSLYSYKFSDGNIVNVCHKHFRKYHKNRYKRLQKAMAEREQSA